MKTAPLTLLAAAALAGCGASSAADGDPNVKPFTAAERAGRIQGDASLTPEAKAAAEARQRQAEAQGQAMKAASGR